MEVLAIIPARSQSKTIEHKNIKIFNGKSLLSYSVEHGLKSLLINRVMINTDSKEYAKIAVTFGAESPFIRPKNLASDLSTDFDVFYHALRWLKEKLDYNPEICVQLRPTYPYRNINDIDKMIQLLIDNPQYDSVRSITKTTENPYKMWTRNSDSSIISLIGEVNGIKEPYNEPRQRLPITYIQNASIDVFWTKTILEKKSMVGKNIYGYVMEHNYDIDNQYEFDKVEKILKK